MNTKAEHPFFSLEKFGVFVGCKSLVTELSHHFDQPELVVLIGHNGCGKSTFLKALAGEISFVGKVTHSLTNISYLGQQKRISFDLQVRDLVVLGCFKNKHWASAYSDSDYQLVDESLTCFGISHLSERSFLELSGGEQQLVWLAMQHIQHAQCYLLDEPTAWLDIRNKKRLMREIGDWPKAYQRMIFMATHDILQLKGCAGKMINLSRNPLVVNSISDELIDSEIDYLENAELVPTHT